MTLAPGVDLRHGELQTRGASGASAGASRMARAHTVEIVRDDAGFASMQQPWNDAVAAAGVPYPFLRHEWVRTWWEAFGAGAALHIVVVRRDGRISAIAPLMRDRTVMFGVPVRRIRFLQNDHTPRTDVIAVSHDVESYAAIWSALRDDRESWDVIQLSQLERDSPTRAAISALAAADGCTTGVWTSGDSPYVPLTGSWDDYFNGRPAKFRSNVRNRLSRLIRLGEPAMEVLADRAGIEAAAEDAWRLEASSWKHDAGTAIGCNPDVRDFYTALIPRGTEAGWLQLRFLTVAGRRIATSYGACFRNRLFLFKTGYDPAYAACSPFKLLTYFIVRDAYEQSLAEVDLLGDAEPWKLEWTPAARGHDWLFVFADTVRARLLRALKFQWAPELRRWRA